MPVSSLNREIPDRLVTAAELAVYYGVTRATVYNLMNRGLPSMKIGRARRFRPSEVDAWLEAQQPEAVA